MTTRSATSLQTKHLRLGHSPDPDDAFMFYALAQDPPLIPTHGYRFEHVLQDIQTLNQRAMKGELEITAISIHAYPYVADKYALTSCGSSMGDKYGPMVVARQPMTIDQLRGKRIAIPGELTTAFLALQLCLGKAGEAFGYEVIPFDQVLRHVKDGKADAGLIIHEGQLTYGGQGLHRVLDLGEWWKRETSLPLPLGGNAVRRELGPELMRALTRLVRETVRYSLSHRQDALRYAMSFARGMEAGVADRFVGMWVNDMTVDCGEVGRRAVQTLLDRGHEAGVIPTRARVDFVDA